MGNTSWLTGTSGSWTNGADWSGGAEPGAADTVLIAAAPSFAHLPYTVTLAASDKVTALTLNQAQASLLISGTLSVSSDVSLTAGNLVLSNGTLTGTAASSYAAASLGSVSIIGNNFFTPDNEIAGLDWRGTLSLVDGADPNLNSAGVLLENVTFTGADGTGRGALSAGTGVDVVVGGAAPLDNVAVALGYEASLSGAGGTLSIGSGANIAASAGSSISGQSLLANAGTITAGAGPYGLNLSTGGSFLNTGTLAASSGGSLLIQSATGSNSGLISAGAGYLRIQATNGFTNTGQVTVAGGTLSLGFALTTAQAAAYHVRNGTLGISGALDNTGATLAAGTLAADQAANLLLDGGTITGGTIAAGALTFDHGTTYAAATGTLSGVTFDGPLHLYTTDLTLENGTVLADPAGKPDRIFLNQGTLTIAGSESLIHTNISLEAGGAPSVIVGTINESAASTLTLDARSEVAQLSQTATLAAATGQDTLISEGLIEAGVNGGTLTANGLINTGVIKLAGEDVTGLSVNAGRVDASGDAALSFGYFAGSGLNSGLVIESGSASTLTLSGALSNTGTISASNGATLSLQTSAFANSGLISVNAGVLEVGTLTTAQLASVHLTHTSLDVTGRLTIGSANPLRIASLGLSNLPNALSVSGTLAGGSVILALRGSAEFSGNAGLDGVHFAGTADVARPLATLTVSGDTVFVAATNSERGPGTVDLTGTGSSLVWNSATTFDEATLDIGSPGTTYEGKTLGAAALVTGPQGQAGSPGGAVQLGHYLTIQQTGLFAAIGDSVTSLAGTLYAPVDSFYSQANIQADAAGGKLTIGGASFTNAGTLAIANGEAATEAATAFTNANNATVSIGAGSTLALNLLAYYVSESTAAQSFSNMGTILLTGGTLSELTDNGSLPAVPLLNRGTISGTGTISAPVLNNGLIEAAGGTLALTGVVIGTGTLVVGAGATLSLAAVGGGETISFAGASGVLAYAPMNFAGPIANFAAGDTIDLLSTAATAAAFSGKDIVVTLANGDKDELSTTTAQTGSLTTASDGHGGTDITFAGSGMAHAVRPEPFWAGVGHVM